MQPVIKKLVRLSAAIKEVPHTEGIILTYYYNLTGFLIPGHSVR